MRFIFTEIESSHVSIQRKSSVDVTVASISKPKSSSFRLAFAVSKSRKVSSGDSRSAEGNAAKPAKILKLISVSIN